jgi:hypothetical protein
VRVRLATRNNRVEVDDLGQRSINGVAVDAEDVAELPDTTATFIELASRLPRFEVMAPGTSGGDVHYPLVSHTHYTLFFQEDYD